MRAGELMNRAFAAVHPDAAIEDVASRLRAEQTGELPVCVEGRLIGMIGLEDVATRGGAGGIGSRRTRVRDVLKPEVVFCVENTDVKEAAQLMREAGVSVLPVLDQRRKVAGLLRLEDIPAELVDSRLNDSA